MRAIEADTPVGVRALTTTRAGGVSRGAFRSLNLADHVGDAAEAVADNRRRLVEQLGLPREPAWLEQEHGTRVLELNGESPAGPADAALTRQPGVVLGVLTADCLPVVLSDREAAAVAVVHAGWRGLAAGVIEAALEAINLAPSRIHAWLGPAISGDAFEVGADVRAAFVGNDPGAAEAFSEIRENKWHGDLYCLARRRLRGAGVDVITGGGFCTHRDSERLFSYRREGQCGRMATLAWLTVGDNNTRSAQ